MQSAKRETQRSFWKAPSKRHGGEERKGLRKIARPLATDRALLVTLKSDRAREKWSLLRCERKIEKITNEVAQRCGVRLYRMENVGNHLHLLVKGHKRRDLQKFFRVLPKAIVYLVTGTRKGKPIGRFWKGLIHTRILEWGEDWRRAKRYLDKNGLEGAGLPRGRIDRIFAMPREKG